MKNKSKPSSQPGQQKNNCTCTANDALVTINKSLSSLRLTRQEHKVLMGAVYIIKKYIDIPSEAIKEAKKENT